MYAALLFNSLGFSSWLDISRIVNKYYAGSSFGSQKLFWEDIETIVMRLE
jgi:hypothetical protein